MANPFPFSSGAVLLASELNSIAEWTTFTTTSTNISISSQNCLYAQVNEIVIASYYVEFSGAASGQIGLSLPVNMSGWSDSTRTGSFPPGIANDATAGTYTIWPCRDSSVIGRLRFFSQDYGAGFAICGTTVPFTWTSGDSMRFSLTYMAA